MTARVTQRNVTLAEESLGVGFLSGVMRTTLEAADVVDAALMREAIRVLEFYAQQGASVGGVLADGGAKARSAVATLMAAML